jgi:hypothetical protein
MIVSINLKRYSNVLNNPLKYTDPSGYTYYKFTGDGWEAFEWDPFGGDMRSFQEASRGGINYSPSMESLGYSWVEGTEGSGWVKNGSEYFKVYNASESDFEVTNVYDLATMIDDSYNLIGIGLELSNGKVKHYYFRNMKKIDLIGNIPMDAADKLILGSGIDAFMSFILDEDYGPEYFLSDIEKRKTRNSETKVLPEIVKFGLKAADWGHDMFPNPHYDELRHQIGTFLMCEKYGPLTGIHITTGNEIYGFVRYDLFDLWQSFSNNDWAFEINDLRNNKSGLYLWRSYQYGRY